MVFAELLATNELEDNTYLPLLNELGDEIVENGEGVGCIFSLPVNKTVQYVIIVFIISFGNIKNIVRLKLIPFLCLGLFEEDMFQNNLMLKNQ